MNEVERGVATAGRNRNRRSVSTLIPRVTWSTVTISPYSIVEIVVIVLGAVYIYISIIIQVAQRSTDHQVVDEGVLHELLLANVPTEGE